MDNEKRVKEIKIGLFVDGEEPTFTGFQTLNMPLDKVRKVEKAVMPLMPTLLDAIFKALN